MRKTAAVILAASVLSGCAAQEAQIARGDCKVDPATARGLTGHASTITELERRHAAAELRSSEYRRGLSGSPFNNNLEEALRDCP